MKKDHLWGCRGYDSEPSQGSLTDSQYPSPNLSIDLYFISRFYIFLGGISFYISSFYRFCFFLV